MSDIEAGSTSNIEERDVDAVKLEQPLLGAAVDGDESAPYEPVIDAGPQKFGCIDLDPVLYAQIVAGFQVFSVLSLLSSLHSSSSKDALTDNLIYYSNYFIFVSWIVVPLWQNFTLRRADTGRGVRLDGGFILVRVALAMVEVCCGRYRLVERFDEEDNAEERVYGGSEAVTPYVHAAPVSTAAESGLEKEVTKCDSTSAPQSEGHPPSITHMPRPVRLTRYLPFSLYNYVYMAQHPGRMLNTALPPPSQLQEFGFSRSLLLVLSTNALGTLNAYLFVYAFVQLDASSGNNPISRGFAIASAVMAVVGYRVTLLSVFFGFLLIPYTLGLYFALFICDLFSVTNPRSDSCVYRMLVTLWENAVLYS